jgi:hypothetical protein
MDRIIRWARIVAVWPDGTGFERILGGRGSPDLAAVETVADLCLAVRRTGGTVRLEQVGPELADLLRLAGLLGELGLPAEPGLHREMGGQPEGGEELLDVEERVDPGDPIT